MELYVQNEFDPLQAVLVHRPGAEIDRLNYHNMRRFLFEDIPYLKRMQEEHDCFVEHMRAAGVTVLYLETLLSELLEQDPGAKADLIAEVTAAEQVPYAAELLMSDSLSDKELITTLFAGLTQREYRSICGHGIREKDLRDEFVLTPIPNAYFSRDPAVVVKDTTISCKMHYRERVRETILTRVILERHSLFTNNHVVYGGSDSPQEDRPYTVEGGDVLVLNNEAVMIGDSERTTRQTIERIAQKAFAHGHVQRLYEVTIPAHRDYMHLDTILTVIDRGTVVWYPVVLDHASRICRYEPEVGHGGVESVSMDERRSLRQILEDEFECPLTIIPTAGGDEHYAPREQRTDGTNVLAIAPRKVIMYERNFKTQEELEKHDVETICIPGSELVRGLGGPRCMSMPLFRLTPSASSR